ncbi:MAG: hypothetical protein ACXWQ5_00095 [Ktedonobacterales bacterium]
MNDVKCFLTERTGKARRHADVSTYDVKCPSSPYGGTHFGRVWLDEVDEVFDAEKGYFDTPRIYLNDDTLPWPTRCDHCGYVLGSGGEQVYRGAGSEASYRNVETGEVYQSWHDIPPGGIQPAPWLDRMYTPQLEHCFNVKCPDGTWWTPDSRASNCSMPDDFKQERHHCWVIEGTLPNITVGKKGPTCAAGAGSIQTSHWHGFLINGWLRTC